jgi:hypothetical protein
MISYTHTEAYYRWLLVRALQTYITKLYTVKHVSSILSLANQIVFLCDC